MPHLNLFDEISSIGWKFLKSTNRGHKALMKYRWQLQSIIDLIKYTHSIVIEKLESIEKSKTPVDAKSIAQTLQGEPLSDSFRASGLCDIFVGYGKALRRIIEGPNLNNDPNDILPISQQDANNWIQFCDSLEERELKVAELYSSEIQDIYELISNLQEGQNLKKIQERARNAKSILADQMADFDSLAEKFRKQLNG